VADSAEPLTAHKPLRVFLPLDDAPSAACQLGEKIASNSFCHESKNSWQAQNYENAEQY